MPLRLSVGVSKKIGLPEYSSAGAHCDLELELEAGLLEDAEVLRNGWAGDRQAERDLTDGARAFAKALENGPPCGVGQRCHHFSVSHCLR